MTYVYEQLRFLVRGGTAANLATVNEVPLVRELVIERDTRKMKLGDGVTAYNALPYITTNSSMIHTVSSPPAAELGFDGDYAVNPNAGEPILYGPKAAGAWPAGIVLKGPPGTPGTPGIQGPPGTGATGAPGLSAYQVAVANGFGGSQTQWLASLQGKQGEPGIQGPPGIAANRRVQLVTDTDTGLVACDWNAYDEIRVTLTSNTTFTFSGALDGQGCILKIKQDSVGGRTVALPSGVRYNALITTYFVTTIAGKADKVGFVFDGADSRYDIVSIVPGI
ncbi:hypothetical protein KWH04_01210 [Xanthomonas campestris pv. trichodesmae]|uniref:Phage tail protein n=2 Tax=Xanthomonas citri TaxID=346 RepID=A0AB33CJW4_XANCI|nr:hypothetical protein [Xanthomonas citri]ASK91042.1 hypothetical protein XcvCFBP7111P_05600 [Xanthomonas citri pv. vignicola]MBV6779289.1 hypothetical protein [Xanthomonas campestris pv. trichodesmae]MBZ3921803.1 hypothetical protein [Xanthomonas campestris pv. trichodesmae]MBZ3926403.1 hypothetical protein [Xanthomonas citri pv. sesbaniae]